MTAEALRPDPEPLRSTNQTLDYVSSLNEYAQKQGVSRPDYTVSSQAGANGLFQASCQFLELSGTGEGASKKQAKNNAAQAVWEQVTRGAASPHAIREYSGS